MQEMDLPDATYRLATAHTGEIGNITVRPTITRPDDSRE
jgi:hypothetical protein